MIEIVFLGDLILDVPDPDHWLAGIAPVIGADAGPGGHRISDAAAAHVAEASPAGAVAA